MALKRPVGRWLGLVLAIGAIAAPPASAAVEQPFVARYTANERGAIWITGSTAMTCQAAAPNCPASQAGIAAGAALNNNGFAMVPVDVDANPGTFNSSSSTFTPPGGYDVLFAGLYFGGRVTAGGGGGAPAPNAAARGTALLQTPASSGYVAVSGAVADSGVIPGAYVGLADVTQLVRAGGAGRYAVANVQSGTGLDRFAGWALVVVYRDPAQPLRSLTVFDGLAAIQQGDPPLSISVSGFKTPLTGRVRSSVGIAAYEGDRGSSGDRLALNGLLLGDAANPTTNLFNSSVSFEGTNTTAQRIPPFVNALGFDSDRIVADGLLANGATTATLAASTTLDQYLIQALTFTTDLSAPRLEVAKSVADLNGGDVEPRDVLRYTVTTSNTGDDAATGVVVRDQVPAGTTLEPGSLALSGGTATAGGRSVGFPLGTLGSGAGAASRFDVVVDGDAPDGLVIANVATASGTGATAGQAVTAASPEITSIVRRPPFAADLKVTPERPVAGDTALATLTLISRLDAPVEDVVLTIDIPGADLLTAKATDEGRCRVTRVVRCSFDRLDANERAKVRVRLRPRDSGSLHPRVTIRAKGVAARKLRVPSVRVRPGRTRLSVTKRTESSYARRGQLVRYSIVVGVGRRTATAHRLRVCDVPGAGLRLRAASRGGALRGGRACWRIGRLAPGHKRRLSVVARVTARTGAVRNVARARASNTPGRRSVAAVARTRLVPGAGACAAASRRAYAAC